MTFQTDQVKVVLLRTQIAENAGFVARSLKAFGYRKLALVAPEFSLDTSSAVYKTASGAAEILENTAVYTHLNEAVADCHRVVGFSRRGHQFTRQRMELRDWVGSIDGWGAQENLALLFGPEDFGLSNEDKHVCETLVYIPTAAETLSLNLAHAVSIVLYELSKNTILPVPSETLNENNAPITASDEQRLMQVLEGLLESNSFFKSGRKPYQIEAVRALLQRLHLSRDEYHTAMGVMNALVRGAAKNGED